jgi:uncharacterized protein (UPF0332 family)
MISWSKKQGMKLVKPSVNLSEEYFSGAEETLRVANLVKEFSNMWLATHKYYAKYLAAYSILMRIGIKTEIHSCTIDVIRLLEKEKIIKFSFSDLLEHDKTLRTDNQYYMKNLPVDFDSIKEGEILLKVRDILDKISESEIQRIRLLI